jgi:chemotaxis protein methyltransferase CheR
MELFSEEEYEQLLISIRLVYGYDFTGYASLSLQRRINQFMSHHAIKQVPDLAKVLMASESLFAEFVQFLSVTVTEMFRDPDFYKSLREKIISRLTSYPTLKIWLAGCATGQEVYSVLILLKEEGLLDRCILFATDINQQSLHVAKQGIYPFPNIGNYHHNYTESGGKQDFSQYYTRHQESVLFKRSLIRNTVFSAHNLATDQSFNEFQLIICRNVIMYFKKELQDKVIRLFYESLCPFGFLALGTKESLLFSAMKSDFSEIDRPQKIYQKRT